MKYKITVFTPTYNRAYTLPTLYDSLKRQSYADFEWLVVDDGSTDDTETLVSKWIKETHSFPIRYYKQQNGGKCRAINRALDLAEGELFFTVDSDDYLTDDALEKIADWESKIPKDDCYCGVAGNIGRQEGYTENTIFEEGIFDGTLLDRYKNVDGERAIVLYTSIHRNYRYPEYDGEKFMTEAIVWNRMAYDGFRMQFHNDVIWIYEYKTDGLTKAGNRLFLENPHGYGLWMKERAIFEGVGLFGLFKLYYTMYAELHELYSVETIAECLQTSKRIITIMKWFFLLRHI